MARILVSGLINIETTLQVESFPIPYNPVNYPFFGIHSSVSGVGYNLAKALTLLGNRVTFLSLIGRDLAAKRVRDSLAADGVPGEFVLDELAHTPQSVILFDRQGKRQIYVDLKDIQEQIYPGITFKQAMADCDLLALCNINFSRPFLHTARQAGKLIATDVHTLSSLDDDYNRDFVEAAHILFMSDELLPVSPEDWIRALWNRYAPDVIVIGLGPRGALLGVKRDNFLERVPAVQVRPVVNTIGAGDALFSAFVHSYARSSDPYEAIGKAVMFAAYKIGATGAAEGFLDAAGLDRLYAETFAR